MPRLLLLAVLAAVLASPARAQTCTTSWAAAVGGDWSDVSKWTNGAPGAGDTACITVAGSYTVTLAQAWTVGGLVVGGTSGTQAVVLARALTFAGRGLHVRAGGAVRVEGTQLQPTSSDVLRIEAGGTVVFADAASVARVPGARVENAGAILAGLVDRTSGTASINVPVLTDGGEIRVESGRLLIDGAHVFRDARLTVDAGAMLTVDGDGDGDGPKVFIEGTLSGEIAGDLVFSDAALQAAPRGATLNLTGTGLQLLAGSLGRRVRFDGTGGVFTNVGLVRLESIATIRSARVFNRGVLRVTGGTLFVEDAGVLRNEADGLVDLVQGGRFLGAGRFDNAGLVQVRRAMASGFASSSLDGTLRSQPGSELRVLRGARLQLDAPGSASLPSGTRLTGDGEVFVNDRAFAVEGTVSPGTDGTPIDTLTLTASFDFSRIAGSPQLVVDVAAGGLSDRLEAFTPAPFRPTGALIVRVRPGYTPRLGDTFTIWQGTTARQLEGAFTQVIADGAPNGLAFVAEPDADASALLLRVVEVAPGGTIAVSTDAPIGGGERSIFLSGPGAPGITAARLDCTECLDADAFGSVPGELVGEGTVREAQFDLTSPRIYGYYDLVIQRQGRADTTVAITVRPFLSYIIMTNYVNRGIGVRPAALSYNWSALRVWNVTNARAPGYTVAAVDRQDGEQVSLALANSNPFTGGARVFEESRPEDGPTRPILAFGRVGAGTSIQLTYGQRILPADVLFPEQTATGPEDDRIPFGEKRTVLGTAAQHASFARTRNLLVGALRRTGDPTLTTYLATVEASDPGALERGVGLVIESGPQYIEGTNSLLERILDRLDASSPVPAGLETSAARPFAVALDTVTGDYLIQSYEAINLDSQTAPASVRALLDAEVVALGGSPSGGTTRTARWRPEGGGSGVCAAPGGPPGGPPNGPPGGNGGLGDDLLAAAHTAALAMAQAQADSGLESLRLLQELVQKYHDTCMSVVGNMRGRTAGGSPSGSCSFAPPPPGGPPGGGGGACTPPSAPADPNDKTANSQYPCEMGTVTVDGVEIPRCVRTYIPRQLATDPLVYSVAFENLPQATANAEFVTITDELDPNLDPSTFTLIGSSADSLLTAEVVGQTATFRFVGIDLPPNVSEPEGQGFVTFSVQPRAGLVDGTEIRNDAEIVFDFNPPIQTPEVVHEIREMADLATMLLVPDFEEAGASVTVEVFVANLQGDLAADVSLTLSLPVAPASVTGAECTGRTTLTCTLGDLEAGRFERIEIEMPVPAIGTYTVAAEASTSVFDGFLPNNREAVTLGVVGVGTEPPGAALREVTLAHPAPNPSRGPVTLRWGLPEAGRARVRVFDLLGREVAVLVPEADAAAGWQTTTWTPTLASGAYIVRLDAEVGGRDETRTRRLVVLR